MKDIPYERLQPLERLEIGDKGLITVTTPTNYKELTKLKGVPQGQHTAIVTAPYTLKCEQYPQLSGRYTKWYGYKRGFICVRADELGD